MSYVKITIIAIVIVVGASAIAKILFALSFVTTATMIIACCTIIGLDAWKNKTGFDVARRLLASIYEYRDALNVFIEPGVVVLYPKSHGEEPHLSEKQRLDQAALELQSKRYDNVFSARQKIYPDIVTSEALWDKEMRSIVDAMANVEAIVSKRFTAASIVNNPASTPAQKQAARDSLKAMLKDPKKQNDALLKNIDALVKKAEDYLKQKMQ